MFFQRSFCVECGKFDRNFSFVSDELLRFMSEYERCTLYFRRCDDCSCSSHAVYAFKPSLTSPHAHDTDQTTASPWKASRTETQRPVFWRCSSAVKGARKHSGACRPTRFSLAQRCLWCDLPGHRFALFFLCLLKQDLILMLVAAVWVSRA